MTKGLPLVSVVVITYKRFGLLKRTIESFQARCTYPALEYILCDDGSDKRIQERMLTLNFDRFLLSKTNQGLGKNTNKGILAAKGEYILQLQDDWETIGPGDFIEAALEVFEERSDVYMIRYRPMRRELPYDLHITRSGRKVKIFKNGANPDSEDYAYTDNPHIKRRAFHEKLGLYIEGAPMTKTEIEFCQRVDSQQEVKIAYIEGYEPFRHIGEEESFNPSRKREQMKEWLEKRWATRMLLQLYRQLKRYKKD